MTKKLIKHGNSLALVIEKPILKMLGIDEGTSIELSIKENSLIIRAAHPKKAKTREEEIEEIAQKIMKKYDQVFKELAKK